MQFDYSYLPIIAFTALSAAPCLTTIKYIPLGLLEQSQIIVPVYSRMRGNCHDYRNHKLV
ncbi:MAG: hypothetical protein NT007_19200 [Candidatus Kapabacteria bacterium]|nr:hypothetical protein [Candidatus Kapabacteria bacterium]